MSPNAEKAMQEIILLFQTGNLSEMIKIAGRDIETIILGLPLAVK
jgi:hypothetical protein